MKTTANLLKQYVDQNHIYRVENSAKLLFENRSGNKLTRAGITYILNKYVESARQINPDFIPNNISPHCIRHSKAMHLLQSGVNLIYIRDLLGHVDLKTTEIYARADTKMKRDALEKADKQPHISELPSWQKDSDLLCWLKDFVK